MSPDNPRLDLDAYLRRLAWSGELRNDYATLAALVEAHMARIPFENLDVLLGRGIRIDLASIQAKLVHARRGGYCFEHATLFAAVLEAIGFTPIRHIARVLMVTPREASPRTHMFLSVPLAEGRFVVDPGFGSMAPRLPVPVDFEVGNHFTATYPSSPFVNRILMRALTPDGRVSVMNRDVTIRRGPQVETLHLADRRELRELLNTYFGFDLPEVLTLRVPAIPEWT